MCVFCEIISGDQPASVVYKDESMIAFLDIKPLTPGHILVVPISHVSSIKDLSPNDACHMMRVGQKMDLALRASDLLCEGVSFVLSDGQAAGQEVEHVHLHVFPRFRGDGVYSCLDPNARQDPGRAQIEKVAHEIKEGLQRIQ
jgi:histidine triad (HIT) family protein